MESIFKTLSLLAGWLLRLLVLLAAGCVLYFPWFKQMWLGYVPVALGLGIVVVIRYIQKRRGMFCIDRLPGGVFYMLLLGVPGVIQLGLIFLVSSEPRFDGLFVLEQARTLLVSGTLDPFTYYPPAQAWYYLPWFTLFGSSYLTAQCSQVPLFLLLIYVVYRWVRDLTTEGAGRWAGLAIAYYPTMILYVLVTPYYFYMYTLMVVLSFYALWRFIQTPTAWKAGLSAGLLAGWGTLTKAVLLMFPIQAYTALALSAAAMVRKKVGLQWVIIFSGFVLVLTPWVLRNIHTFGEPVLVCTSGGLVIYSANNPESNGLYSPQPDQVHLRTPQEMLAHSRWCSRQAKTWIQAEPIDFLFLSAKKFLYTWGNETTFAALINRRGQFYAWLDDGISFLAQTGWAVLVGWMTWCIGWGGKRRWVPNAFETLMGVIVCSHALVYLLYEGGARHHLPLVPLLIVYAAVFHARQRSQSEGGCCSV